MNPEDRELLLRVAKQSEENNKILRSMKRAARWSFVWGVIRFIFIVVPLIIGYLYLQPYLGGVGDSFKQAQTLLNGLKQ